MPNSILVKLVHPDEEKRVHNPRIETIVKIAEYFKGDGFEVAVEDFFSVRKNESMIAANSISPFIYENVIPVYSIDSDLTKNIGDIRTKLSKKDLKAIAIVTNRFIPPIFEKGTVFIVDTEIKPENESLLAVKENGQIKIKKLIIDNNKYLLDSESKGGKKQELFFIPPRNFLFCLDLVVGLWTDF